MTDPKVEAFLREIETGRSDQFALISQLRDIVLASGPAISEEIKYGGILFSSAVNFCGIFSYDQHVTLEFSQGAFLADPYLVLKGTGKYRRHVKLIEASEIVSKHLAEYIKSARSNAAK